MYIIQEKVNNVREKVNNVIQECMNSIVMFLYRVSIYGHACLCKFYVNLKNNQEYTCSVVTWL